MQSRLRQVEHANTLSHSEAMRQKTEQSALIQQLQDELDKARRMASEQKVAEPITHRVSE